MQKMEQLNLRIERRLVDDIDSVIVDGTARSRSEYIRLKLREAVTRDKRRQIDELAAEIADKLRAKGVQPARISRKDRDALAEEFAKKKGFIGDR